VGARVRVRAALLHQVLRHLQVALLARQVQGRGTVLGLGIHSPANAQHPSWVLGACHPPKFPSTGGLEEWVGEGLVTGRP
jgi:hypothetical protein